MITTMSTKGQVVIPRKIREDLDPGTAFTVQREDDMIILKKVKRMTEEEWKRANDRLDKSAAKSQRELEKLGLTEQDVINMALEYRYERASRTRTS
ncbi:MAG: AbrB/MazE/SpoVT family DNA-binding domain-containing protein [Candidatus Woesearchaeota archaeon]|nr:AbrB/MazE/SpoVT family DNA-binding domain-containing protein [Candidatus Woesearchaeota archaeon]